MDDTESRSDLMAVFGISDVVPSSDTGELVKIKVLRKLAFPFSLLSFCI
jgi:hypothetical protein